MQATPFRTLGILIVHGVPKHLLPEFAYTLN